MTFNNQLNLRCYLISITAANNKRFTFTSLDMPLTVGGILYSPAGGTAATATSQEIGLSMDNINFTFYLEEDFPITRRYVDSGALDYGEVIVALVDFTDLPSSIEDSDTIIFRGYVGTVDLSEATMQIECLNEAEKLNKNYSVTVSILCRFKFGDSNCTINRNRADLKKEAIISSFSDTGSSTTINFNAQPNNNPEYFRFATVLFTSGANNGMEMEVESSSITNGTLKLKKPTPELVEVGDSFEIKAGCSRSISACNGYDNTKNFGGGITGGRHFISQNRVQLF